MSYLALADGTVWHGESVGADGHALGEAVFTTGMSGYQEAVTDPSFEDQLICFTAPMVGNYGVAEERSESARDARPRGADARGARAGMDGLAARARHRRAHRDRHAEPRPPPPRRGLGARRSPSRRDLRGRGGDRARARSSRRCSAARSSRTSRRTSRTSSRRRAACAIGVVDYGVKNSVLRRLAKAGAAVTVHPHDVDADELAGYDGVLLSPGPGDPEPLAAETETVRQLLGRTHVLGICLGHQLIARATGHDDVQAPVRPPRREPSGARAADGPRARHEPEPRLRRQRRARRPRCRTSRSTTARSRGSTCRDLRARSLQFHPEAGPGPHDAWPLLEALGGGGGRCRGAPTSSRSASSAPARS